MLVSEGESRPNIFILSRSLLHFSNTQFHYLDRIDDNLHIIFVAVIGISLVWVVILTIQNLMIK